ncbi:MAG: redox-regulated ATPase YchF [Nitrososphaeria archaeon]|nr:redox-regulated ATPase YchF [Nitrososphaeria archaeon]
MMLVGIIGKTNVGKSTFFSAATMLNVPIGNYPFTTINPNVGIGYFRTKCVCREFGVKDNPTTSICIDGVRLIPVKLMDVAGLVPGASSGRGLGNKFLDDLRQADALIHVVDAAGSTDVEGRPVTPGSHDPLEDIQFVENELDLWLQDIIKSDWQRICKVCDSSFDNGVAQLQQKLSGLSIARAHILKAIEDCGLINKKFSSWTDSSLIMFVRRLRELSKPIVIAANKIDLFPAPLNYEKIKSTGRTCFPCSAEAELVLRRASEKKLIEYIPGDPDFKIISSNLNEQQKKALEVIRDRVLKKWGSTGVQEIINFIFKDILHLITVYPVEDERSLSDKEGNVLPEAYLIKSGSTAKDLAYKIHSDLGDGFLYAIDVKRGIRIGAEHILSDGDVIKIVSTKARG